ncbi:hypothetical protein IJH26_01110 [Candidatus Saccharibacteria bacterium]|nr:hypothetical protein [Candidatus Saccharibacteria bacterium]
MDDKNISKNTEKYKPVEGNLPQGNLTESNGKVEIKDSGLPTKEEVVAAFVDPESQNNQTSIPSIDSDIANSENPSAVSNNESNEIPTPEEVTTTFIGPEPENREIETPRDTDENNNKEIIVSSPAKKSYKFAIIFIICITIMVIGGVIFAISNSNSNKDNKPTVAIADLTDEQREKLGVEPEIKENTDTSKIEDKDNYSEEYKKYLELSDEEKAKLEVIPRKEEVPDEKIDEIRENTDDNVIATLPEKFDLRNIINVTVSNQGSYGLCWDYASGKALETHMSLQGVDYNPSELQIDFLSSSLMYGNRELHDGGTFQMFADIASSVGTISEEKFSSLGINPDGHYGNGSTNYDYFKLAKNDAPLYITKTVDFPSMQKTAGKVNNKTDEEVKEFRNLVKAHIMTNGALYMVMDAPDSFIFKNGDGKTTYFYTSDSSHSNTTRGPHAMAIVGWDDKFSKDNFKGTGTGEGFEKPIHDGAYLVLNSWGDHWGEGGYFWVSYDEYNVESQLSGIIATALENNATRIDTINSQLTKDLIKEKLGFYIIDDNGEKYITDYALDRVSYLNLSSRNLNNDDLARITEAFPNISSLTITDNNISDLSPLANLKNLSSVHFSKNIVEDISVLCNMDKINSFNLSYNKITDISCLDGKLNDHAYIDISGNVGITGFEKLTNLSSLIANEIGLESLEPLSNLHKLSQLTVRNNNIKSLAGLSTSEKSFHSIDLSGNKGLVDIKLDKPVDYFTIDDVGLTDISILNNIEATIVSASGNNFGDLSRFNNDKIIQLNLSDNKNLSNLSSLNTLKNLNLSNCGITSLSDIGKLNDIETLILSNNEISSLNGIEKLEKLSSLAVDNNHLSSLDGISKLQNLKSISADNNMISNADELLVLENLYFASFNNNRFTSVPNFSDQSGVLYLAFDENPLENIIIPKAAATISLKNCDIKTIDYSVAEKLVNINLEGNPKWNGYSSLISKSISGRQESEHSYAYIHISTDYDFSKEELNELNNISELFSNANWYINLKEYHNELKKSQDGTIHLEEHPNERALFMSMLKSDVSMNGFTIDRAATKITLDDSTVDSLSFNYLTNINNNKHIRANTVIFNLK